MSCRTPRGWDIAFVVVIDAHGFAGAKRREYIEDESSSRSPHQVWDGDRRAGVEHTDDRRYGEQDQRGACRLEHDRGVLIVRATKKLAERLGGFTPSPADPDQPRLGEWYATVMFWRPQVALFVSETTLIPVFVPLAPATTVVRRLPVELAVALRRHGVSDAFIDAEISKMSESRCLPTASRSMVGVVNEYVRLAEHSNARRGGTPDLGRLSDWLAHTPMGPLRDRGGFPDRELAALVARST